jgi:hypothetical protein
VLEHNQEFVNMTNFRYLFVIFGFIMRMMIDPGKTEFASSGKVSGSGAGKTGSNNFTKVDMKGMIVHIC